MFKKYITIQIIPSTSKKAKKIRIAQFTSLLFAFFFRLLFASHSLGFFLIIFPIDPYITIMKLKKYIKKKNFFSINMKKI